MSRDVPYLVRVLRKAVVILTLILLRRFHLRISLLTAIAVFDFRVVLKDFIERKIYQVVYPKVRDLDGVFAVEKRGSSNELLTIVGISSVVFSRICLLAVQNCVFFEVVEGVIILDGLIGDFLDLYRTKISSKGLRSFVTVVDS